MLRKWDKLPQFMQMPEVRPYWEILYAKRGQLLLKRLFDLVFALVLLVILAIPMLLIAILIKLDSKGPVFYRQERVTTYGKHFRIHLPGRYVVHNERADDLVRPPDNFCPEGVDGNPGFVHG